MRAAAVISNVEAMDMIRDGVPCGVCGADAATDSGAYRDRNVVPPAPTSPRNGAARALLREADGEPVAGQMLDRSGHGTTR